MKKVLFFCIVVFCLSCSFAFAKLAPGVFLFPGGDGSGWTFSKTQKNPIIGGVDVVNGVVVTATKMPALLNTEKGTVIYSYIKESEPWMISLCDTGFPWVKTKWTFANVINPLLVFRSEHSINEDKIFGYSKDYMDALVTEMKRQEGVRDVTVLEGSQEWLIWQYSYFFDFQPQWMVVSVKTIFKDPKRETETFEIWGQISDEPMKITSFSFGPGSPEITVYSLDFWYTTYSNDKREHSILLWRFYLTDQGIFSIQRQTDLFFPGELLSYQEKDDYSLPFVKIESNRKGIDVMKKTKTTWGSIKAQ